MPIEPPPTGWELTLDRAEPLEDLVGVGADLQPGTVLAAYRAGLFPMGVGVGGGRPLGWWSPDPRGVLLPGDLHVSRSLRRSLRGFELTVDEAFDDVLDGCADPTRHGAWITEEVAAAYRDLHALGWARSIEVWQDGELVGGLYGLLIDGLFAAESKFHHVTDASKAAVVGLVRALESRGGRWLVDVQWQTPHLASLGVRQVTRTEYLRLLADALADDPARAGRFDPDPLARGVPE